jgi:hypothetical protein
MITDSKFKTPVM